MLSRVRSRRGFTLVELLIVILLIAILMAIAIPNFLGSRRKAADRAAQQTIRTAVTSLKSYTADRDDFNTLANRTTGVAALKEVEPNIEWSATTANYTGNERPVAFSVRAAGTNLATKVIVLTAPGADNGCWIAEIHLDNDNDQYGYATGDNGVCDPTLWSASNIDDQEHAKKVFPERP